MVGAAAAGSGNNNNRDRDRIDNDLAAARALALGRRNRAPREGGAADRGANPEAAMLAQVQMAMQLNEMENRMQER